MREDVVRALGLLPKGKRRVSTANGEVWCREVLFRIGFIVGDYESSGFDPEPLLPHVLDKHVSGYELQGALLTQR